MKHEKSSQNLSQFEINAVYNKFLTGMHAKIIKVSICFNKRFKFLFQYEMKYYLNTLKVGKYFLGNIL